MFSLCLFGSFRYFETLANKEILAPSVNSKYTQLNDFNDLTFTRDRDCWSNYVIYNIITFIMHIGLPGSDLQPSVREELWGHSYG